jgi:Ca2+-binding RTX toxin-like protein
MATLTYKLASGDSWFARGTSTDNLIVYGDSPTTNTKTATIIPGADHIQTGSGNDVVYGDMYSMLGQTGGNDGIMTGAGADTVYGDAYEMNDGYRYVAAHGGSDNIQGGAGPDTLFGDAYVMRGHSVGGDDIIVGGTSDMTEDSTTDLDTLMGDAYAMWDRAVGGNDWIIGGAGNDVIIGDAREMHGSSQGGNDWLEGGTGDDYIYGDSVTTFDSAKGGNDTIIGGLGNDQMWGSGGNDTFCFGGMSEASGHDVVYDFGLVAGNFDTIQVPRYPIGYGGPTLSENSHGDVVIHFGGENDVTLVGIHQSQFNGPPRVDLSQHGDR